jgi:hypothetical protein
VDVQNGPILRVRPVDHHLLASQIAEVLETKSKMMIRKCRDADHGTGGARRFKHRDVVTCWTWPKTPAAGRGRDIKEM